MKLSVITPVLNGAAFIEGCLENVISQLPIPGFEHIVIDGGSTDQTVEILKRFAGRHPHLRWISEPDNGQSHAMNKGIAMAKGELIGFLNVDDFYQPGVLNRILGLADSLSVPSFIVGNCHVLDEEGRVKWVNKPARLTFQRMLYGPVVQPYPQNPSAYFYHRMVHDLFGGYDPNEHFALDFDMLFRIIKTTPVLYFDEHWGNHRFLPGTKTFVDTRNGLAAHRVRALVEPYRRDLPYWSRQWSALVFYLTSYRIFHPLFYFSQQPEEFILRTRRRFSSVRHWIRWKASP